MMENKTEKTEALLRTVGMEIAKRRCAKGWSQEQLAAQVPITASKLSRIECGKVNSKTTTLIGISKALGVGVDDLLRTQRSNLSEAESLLAGFTNEERNVICDLLESARVSVQKYLR